LVRTVAEPAADNALRQAASDFCEQTNIWVENLDPISAVAGISEYDLESATGSAVAQVQSVSFDGRLLRPRAMDELDKLYANSYWPGLVGVPVVYTQVTDSTIQLVPTPQASVANAIRVRASLFPDNTATSLPDLLYSRYANEIAVGAAAKLMGEQGREYYDPNMSVVYSRKFVAAINQANARTLRSRTRASLRVAQVRI
jgi:hypothetical protein